MTVQQRSLFDPEPDPPLGDLARLDHAESRALGEQGMSQVWDHNQPWGEQALQVFKRLAESQLVLSTDDLWQELHASPPHPNCMGALMRPQGRPRQENHHLAIADLPRPGPVDERARVGHLPQLPPSPVSIRSYAR